MSLLCAHHERRLPSSGGLFVALAVVGLLFPPTVNPCPVKAGLTKVRGASCCATKVVAEQAPVRSCCARKAASKPVESKVAGCGVQTSCCCKARPAPGQAVVALITRLTSEPVACLAFNSRAPVESSDPGVDRLPTIVIPDSPAHLNRLLCTWQI